jgi:hypothetical protein
MWSNVPSSPTAASKAKNGEKIQEPNNYQQPSETGKRSGCCGAAPLLGHMAESQKIYAYLIDTDKNSFVGEPVTGLKEWLSRPDFYTLAVNKLIKDNNGIKSNQKIRFSPVNLPTPDSIVRLNKQR